MELRPPLHLGVVAIEKGAIGSPSIKVANFTFSKTDKEILKSIREYNVFKSASKNCDH